MSTNYSEQDTERARAAEATSAGVPTQQLGVPPVAAPSALPLGSRDNPVALGLMAIGALLLFGRLVGVSVDLAPGMVLLTIASCFLFFAFWKRIYGLLIPGSILAGLSVGVTFADMTNGVSVLWGLSLGFLAILFVGRTLFGKTNSWPAIPTVILFAIGVIIAAANLPGLLAGGLVWLPLLLIGAGLYLGWGRRRTA